MLKTLVMDFLMFKPKFSRRLSRIFFSASSRLSRNFRGRLAGLAQIAAGGWLRLRLWGLAHAYFRFPLNDMCRLGTWKLSDVSQPERDITRLSVINLIEQRTNTEGMEVTVCASPS